MKLARGEFQRRLHKYIKGISATLANITYRPSEVENAQILYPIQFHSNPRRGHAMPVQQQIPIKSVFSRVRKLDVVHFMQKRGEKYREK